MKDFFSFYNQDFWTHTGFLKPYCLSDNIQDFDSNQLTRFLTTGEVSDTKKRLLTTWHAWFVTEHKISDNTQNFWQHIRFLTMCTISDNIQVNRMLYTCETARLVLTTTAVKMMMTMIVKTTRTNMTYLRIAVQLSLMKIQDPPDYWNGQDVSRPKHFQSTATVPALTPREQIIHE